MPKRSSSPSSAHLLYGRQAVREALRANRRHFRQLILAERLKPAPVLDDIRQLAARHRLAVRKADRRQLDDRLGHSHHQGVVLDAGPYPYAQLDDIFALAQHRKQSPFLLLLDRVQDPQNLGTLIRTAEACGIHGIVIPQHRAAAITPAVVNSSAGAAEHLLVSQQTNLVNCMRQLKKQGVWIAGLEKHADAVPLTAVDWCGAMGIVVGSEGSGLGRLVREHCDWLVALPMHGQINSLNAAVAGSIVVFWAAQQRFSSTAAGPA